MKNTRTGEALDYAIGIGIMPAIDEPEALAKKLPKQCKMVLLRYYNDIVRYYNDIEYDGGEKFEDYIREKIRPYFGLSEY